MDKTGLAVLCAVSGGQCRHPARRVERGFFSALEGFPDAAHDDDADACGGAFGMFVDNTLGMLDWMAAQVVAKKGQRHDARRKDSDRSGHRGPCFGRHPLCDHRQGARVVWTGRTHGARGAGVRTNQASRGDSGISGVRQYDANGAAGRGDYVRAVAHF